MAVLETLEGCQLVPLPPRSSSCGRATHGEARPWPAAAAFPLPAIREQNKHQPTACPCLQLYRIAILNSRYQASPIQGPTLW